MKRYNKQQIIYSNTNITTQVKKRIQQLLANVGQEYL